MVSSHPSTCASLSTLPTEILTTIISHTDSSTAASLSRVARRFSPLSERALWREVQLSVNPHYGQLPLVQPVARTSRPAYESWAEAEAKNADARYNEGLRLKVTQVLVQANIRRLGMVEKVVATPRPGAAIGILMFCDMVSPTLRYLHLTGSQLRSESYISRPSDFDIIDIKALDFPHLSFPSLIHLHIRPGAVRFAEFAVLLVRAAPSLISLDVDIAADVIYTAEWEDTMVPPYPPPDLPQTKIRQLRLAYENPVDSMYVNAITEVIRKRSLVEQLSIRYYHEYDDGVWTSTILAIAEMPNLRDLHLSCELRLFWDEIGRIEVGDLSLPSLRRLALSMAEDLDFLIFIPCVPSVEILYLEHVDGKVPKAPSSLSPTTPPPTMIPPFASSLRDCQNLHTIYSLDDRSTSESDDVLGLLDEIEQSGTPTGIIRSLRHGDEELVHARILLHHYELAEDLPMPTMRSQNIISVDYMGVGAEFEGRYYQPRPGLESAWQDFIGFDGYTVPSEVIERMRLAAGVDVEDWVGRGVEVGEKAWAVLTEWRDSQLVLQAREGISGLDPTL